MAPRSAQARVAVDETEFDLEALNEAPGPRPLLTFDFTGRRAVASKGPVSPDERSTIKETIIRWLEGQL
ncbi:MAG: hypothetical protein ACYC8T_11525 [Myxococcaceae bacterium]